MLIVLMTSSVVYVKPVNSSDLNNTRICTSDNPFLLEVYTNTNKPAVYTTKDVIDPIDIYPAEEMPEYPGGKDAISQFLDQNTKYPEKALRLEGKVFISFVVETDGILTEFKVLKGFDSECNNEALRISKLMHKWKPGRHNGKIARMRIVMPIIFSLPSGTGELAKT